MFLYSLIIKYKTTVFLNQLLGHKFKLKNGRIKSYFKHLMLSRYKKYLVLYLKIDIIYAVLQTLAIRLLNSGIKQLKELFAKKQNKIFNIGVQVVKSLQTDSWTEEIIDEVVKSGHSKTVLLYIYACSLHYTLFSEVRLKFTNHRSHNCNYCINTKQHTGDAQNMWQIKTQKHYRMWQQEKNANIHSKK